MTEKVFWIDPYKTQLKSIVTQISGDDIELSQTIFYAESGGQESDKGTIAGVPVVKAHKSGTRIVYSLESASELNVGDEVLTEIDWSRRYALMKLHFAAEVVLELFTQRFNGIHKVGAHISEDKSRIDFEWPENIGAILPEIQREAQALLDSDSVIESAFSDEPEERRYWKVEGFAQVSCGGTHLKRTKEVGQIALKRKNVGKGKERVEIRLV